MSKKVVMSWSGGKDSCFALHRLLEEGWEVVALLSMVSNEYRRNHVHGIPFKPLKMQAEALGIPLVMRDSGEDHEKGFVEGLADVRDEYGAEAAAFGTLYVERDRKWNGDAAEAAGLEPLFPMWIPRGQAGDLLREWIGLGYESVICRASETELDTSWVGQVLDADFIDKVSGTSICPMGELGEYHTVVVDGPIFHKRLEITSSETVLNSGLWSLDILEASLISAPYR